MHVYVDDERETPEGWTRAYTADEAIALLKTGLVKVISLDHDLADNHYSGNFSGEKTGYSVALWIEEQVFTNNFIPPTMFVHSMNPVGVARIRAVISNIENHCLNRVICE